jgi:light-regulated signal transduction histidine kinase (bacteriophytochrome)
MQYKPVDFNALIESVRAQLLGEVEGRLIEWTVADLPVVKADTGLMKVVWTNLLENAVKYTRPREKAIIHIGVLSDEDPSRVTFFVKDNGVGFDPQFAEKIFGVFQRLHKESDFEGSGVGLATVQRIVRRHGGRIWAEAKPDEGATFFFSLPKRT